MQFFSSTLILASGPMSEPVIHSSWRSDLTKNGQGLSANSDLPHRSREGCNFSFTGLGALRTGGMSSNAQAPWDESCSPVSATVSRALRGAAHQKIHGFADGSSGCQGARSLPALFVSLWLHPSCCSAKRPRVLLTQDLGDQITDLLRFPQVKSQFQFRVPVDTFRDFSKEQATTVATEQSPGLVTAHGSFEVFCPSHGVSRDQASRECHRGGSAKLVE